MKIKTMLALVLGALVAGVAMAIGFLVAFVLGECGLIAVQEMLNNN